MTTRTGLVGLVSGIIASGMLFCPFYIIWPDFYLKTWPAEYRFPAVILALTAAILLAWGGGLASAWSGTVGPGQRIGLGALAGGVAGFVLFSAPGAAVAGLKEMSAAENGPALETSLRIISQTQMMFWGLTLGGVTLGAAGAAIQSALNFPPRRGRIAGVTDPQMALNTTITALPATAFAVALVTALFPRQPGLTETAQALLEWPLFTGLALYLLAHLALTLVTPYEARQARHRCGIDEVKMAAYVGIGTPIALITALGILNPSLITKPPVLGSLLLSLGMLARTVFVLFSLILPIRAKMPPPADEWEAAFFGSIAGSHWQSLSLLCLGCGMMMVAPIYVVVGAVSINLAFAPFLTARPEPGTTAMWARRLYETQAIAGLGSSLVVVAALIGVYLFYLGLGKSFRRRRNSPN